jgi:hypothetical protein
MRQWLVEFDGGEKQVDADDVEDTDVFEERAIVDDSEDRGGHRLRGALSHTAEGLFD